MPTDLLSYISKLFGDSADDEMLPPGGPGASPSFAQQRARLPSDDPMQTVLAPFEHREFAQEYVQENPITGPIVMAGAIPAYAAYKTLRPKSGARTKPSLDQVFAGFEGVARGIKANLAGGATKRSAAKPTVMAGDPYEEESLT